MVKFCNDLVHELDIGISRYGKSYNCKTKFLAHRGGGIFFNPRRVKVKGTIGIDRNSSLNHVINALKQGYKLTYMLSGSLAVDRKDINRIINILFTQKWSKTLLLVFDEAQDYAPQGDIKSGLLRVARTGLGENIQAIFNCQRPADLSKIIVAQCERKIFYRPAQEDFPWILKMRYPLEDILARIKDRKYYYVEYFGGVLSEAKTIKFKGEL